jgi:PTS system nitrogen regulatory IIA component
MRLDGSAKKEIIEEMVDALVRAGKLPDKAEALKAVLDRELKMSTGIQHGVAIPHGKIGTIQTLVTALGLKREGVDFGALDGEVSRIFVMTISPVIQTGPHLKYLAEICRVLDSQEVRERLLDAKTPDEMVAILTE